MRRFFNVNLYAADGTVYETLSAFHPARKEAEYKARWFAKRRTLKDGQKIAVDVIEVDETEYADWCLEGFADDLEYGEYLDYGGKPIRAYRPSQR